MEYALHDLHIHIKEISTKWSGMRSLILEFATEKRLKEELSENLIEIMNKIQKDYENSFFEDVKQEFNKPCRTPYSTTETQLLDLLEKSAKKLRNIGCRGLKII